MAENACDMRGFLSFLILWLLSKKPMTGAQLAQEIENRKGCKPNPGTIYPALKILVQKKVVIIKPQGREKIYLLTPHGKKELNVATVTFTKAFYDVVK